MPELFKEMMEGAKNKSCDEQFKGNVEHLKEMKLPPTVRQLARIPPRVGKYDPCPCDSGRKFKWCCWDGKARGGDE